MVTKIPLQVDDLDKIPLITNDVKSMLRLNSKVFLGMEAPYCFLSRIESSFAELTLGCNLKHMSKDELHSTEQDLLLQSVQIIKKHGARLGSTWQDTTGQ
nr:mechanosensitive ion channel protein 1, mitochondrial [Quercus suber]